MPSAADVLSLAQWGAASPMGLDLTEGDDQMHQFNLGQFSSDTQDMDFDTTEQLAQAKVGAKVGMPAVDVFMIVCFLVVVLVGITGLCLYFT